MDKQGRYKTSGMVEDQYMPGSDGLVLKNLLDITTKDEIDRVETELLFELTDQLLDELDGSREFSAGDIRGDASQVAGVAVSVGRVI